MGLNLKLLGLSLLFAANAVVAQQAAPVNHGPGTGQTAGGRPDAASAQAANQFAAGIGRCLQRNGTNSPSASTATSKPSSSFSASSLPLGTFY